MNSACAPRQTASAFSANQLRKSPNFTAVKKSGPTANSPRTKPCFSPSGQLFHILAEVQIPEGARLVLNFRGLPVVLTSKALKSGHKPASVQDHVQTVEFLVDRTSIEAFVNKGEISSTRFALPKSNGLSLKAEGGPVAIRSLTLFRLNSAWLDKPEN